MNERSFEEVLEQDGYFCWKNVGVSMLPLLREGKDVMVIHKRPAGRLHKYDVVLFTRPNISGRGKYVLHRILKVNEDGTYWIVGDNCVSGETVQEEHILGVLTAVVRNGKRIDANDQLYKLYVRLWCAPYPVRFGILRLVSIPRRAVGMLLRAVGLYKYVRHSS